jgi:class 3 adenylate cyclase/predicted alpha/beta hydrolase
MIDIPEPRYAKAADGVQLAYQVFGSGRRDIVYLGGNASHIDVFWEWPPFAAFFRSPATLGRVILMDRRGVGLSDRLAPDDLPPVEVAINDLATVLDTVRSLDTVLLGTDEGAQTAVLFAATHPDRVRHLILWGPRPSILATPEHPWGGSRAEWEEWLEWAGDHWGSRESIINDLHELAPKWLTDEDAIAWGTKAQRASVSPRAAHALFRISMELNVADVLPAVRTPTLVVHRRDDRAVPIEAGRAVAGLLPNATFVELPGEAHAPEAEDTKDLLEAMRVFVKQETEPVDRSRRLATVLFTDIVDSTRKVVELGDERWKDLLALHNGRAKAEIAKYAGTFIDSTGDGTFATFEGPARAVRCAQAIATSVRDLGLEVRAGCHTGEVELAGDRVRGIAVHVGARIAAIAGPAQVMVSSTVKDLVAGSGLTFEDAGEYELKGIPDRWHLYRVVDQRL